MQVQDNTGKGKKQDGKSLSSVFAQVNIPKSVSSRINGEPLAEDLLQSLNSINIESDAIRDSVTVDLINISDEIKIMKYKLINRVSAEITTLFEALNVLNVKGYEVIQDAIKSKNIDLINQVNSDGDTPLMFLLKDPLTDGHLKSIAKLLIPYSIWNQPNNDGKTAQNLLDDRSSDWEELNIPEFKLGF